MNSGNLLKTLLLLALVFLSSCSVNRMVTIPELKDHIGYLASDELKGRMTASEGDSLAAEYIRAELAKCGFVPVSGDGFQRFKITTNLVEGPGNHMSVDGVDLIPGQQFMALSFSSNSELEAEVIFAGYGFNINEDSLKWNDYQGIDVEGKWVMVFRSEPDVDKAGSPFIPYATDRAKALTARDMGAAGILLISGESFDPQDSFESLNPEDMAGEIPVIRIKRTTVAMILSKKGAQPADLEKSLNTKRGPASFGTGVTVKAGTDILRETGTTRNVVMMLPGEDEALKNEYVILGAHFDHLGMGGKGSSSMRPDTIAVHHGADDNASGVGLMLELAEEFAMTGGSHPRSIVCIAFTGEEKGLLGSKYFVDNPEIDLAKVNAMINLDMVGRLQKTKIVQISGVGTADDFKDMITSLNDSSAIRLALSEAGYGPSDHSSFYVKNIPVLFFTTGPHLDYHTPADIADSINYEGMTKIAPLVFGLASRLASSPERLKFREAGPKVETGRQVRRKSVTIGIMPDVSSMVKNGLRAEIVTPGKPASLAGMKNGDIITAINGKSISNIYDYMSRMAQFKQGQTITVDILRGSDKLTLLIQL